MNKLILLFSIITFSPIILSAQSFEELKKGIEQLQNNDEELDHKIYQLEKQIDDIL
ncbi:MAG TPA: hypothetical protein VLA03_04190 [Draconibacterium sp.]|nr:hypothetical protein [Draconibacterium sp.]